MNRVIPGLLLAVGWLLLLLYGSFHLFWAVVSAATAIALHEFFRMSCPWLGGWRRIVAILSCLLPVMASVAGQSDLVLAGVIGSLLATAVVALHGYTALEDVLRFLLSSGFATVYVAVCIAHVVLLRFHPQGAYWLLMLAAIVAGSDTGAYYAGRTFGERKLFPQISPKKTVAGGVGGLLAGMAAALLLGLFAPTPVRMPVLLFSAALLVVVGIAGDLTESMLKRAVGVKDSGAILFGHGGVLDRIDSLLLTGPVLYYFLHLGLL